VGSRRDRGRRRGERGAALVEAAIVMPLILLLTFGAIEFGIGFSQKAGIEAIARSGAREGAAQSSDPNLANDVATAVNNALGSSSLPDMQYLAVYRIPGDGSPPDLSENGGGPGCATNPNGFNDCAIFFFHDGSFDAANPLGAWDNDPAVRVLCGPNPDRIGVKIYSRFHFLTNLVGTGDMELDAQSILQLEPQNCSN